MFNERSVILAMRSMIESNRLGVVIGEQLYDKNFHCCEIPLYVKNAILSIGKTLNIETNTMSTTTDYLRGICEKSEIINFYVFLHKFLYSNICYLPNDFDQLFSLIKKANQMIINYNIHDLFEKQFFLNSKSDIKNYKIVFKNTF